MVHLDGAGGTVVPVMLVRLVSLISIRECLTMARWVRQKIRLEYALVSCRASGMQNSSPGVTGSLRRECATSMLSHPDPQVSRLGGSLCSRGKRIREMSLAGRDARWL